MAGVACSPIYQGRGSTDNAKEKTRIYVYRVTVDTATDTDSTVLAYVYAQVGVRLGAALAEDGDCYCVSTSVSWVNTKQRIVTAVFSSARELVAVQSGSTQDPIEIEWNTVEVQSPAEKDKDGNAVVNSAGDPFDPPAMKDESRWQITVRTSVSSVPSYVLNYRNRVNNASVTLDGQTFAARTLLVRRIAIGKEYIRNSGTARDITIVFEHDESTWDLVQVDRGYRILDPSDVTKRILALNDDKTLPSSPILLDGAGAVLDDPSASTAVYITDKVYAEATFAGNLPGCS